MFKVLGRDPHGYDVVNLVGQVSSEVMRDVIRDFFLGESVNSKDTLLFYFSGHGALDKFGNNYLASSQIDSRDPDSMGFWSNELDEVIENSISQRKVIVLDCCYAGAFGSTGSRKRSKKGGEEEAKKGQQQSEIKFGRVLENAFYRRVWILRKRKVLQKEISVYLLTICLKDSKV